MPGKEYVWLDGKIVPEEKAVMPIKCQAVQYGLACFEGIRFYNTPKGPAIFRLKEHMKRWKHSMDVLRMKPYFSIEELSKGIIEIIRINKLQEGYIRPWVGYTERKLGLTVDPEEITLALFAEDWPAYFGKETKARISTITRPHPESFPMEAKICGMYVNSFLAQQEARENGFSEAILLDSVNKEFAEASVSNIFFVKNFSGRIQIETPPLGSILPGITRDTVITLCKDINYDIYDDEPVMIIYQKVLTEIFICGTAIEVVPVVQLDDKILNGGKIGPVTRRLQELYKRIVAGQETKYEHWLTYVD